MTSITNDDKHNIKTTNDTVVIFEELTNLIKLERNLEFKSKLKFYQKTKRFSVDTQNEYGNTLLHAACKNRNYEITKVLLEIYRAKPDIQNADGRTPLHIATIYGSTDKTFYTFQKGWTKQQMTNASNIIDLMVNRSPYVLLIRDKDNMTPMNYFNTHSDITSNTTLNTKYKSYKRSIDFFDALKIIDTDSSDYELSLSIYFALKNNT